MQRNLLLTVRSGAKHSCRVYIERSTYVLCNLRSSLDVINEPSAIEKYVTGRMGDLTVAVKHRILSAWTSFANLATETAFRKRTSVQRPQWWKTYP